MIVLDTNVVSELLKEERDPAVAQWVRRRDAVDLATTTVTLAEMRYGVERLPEGRRRDRLASDVATAFATYGRQLLAFDRRAANEYGTIVASRERAGLPIGTADAQIAAICRSRHASIATRNTADFDGTGIDVINPWEHIGE